MNTAHPAIPRSDKGIRVTCTDLESGESSTRVVGLGDFVLIPTGGCYLDKTARYGNGTVVLTLKGHAPTKPKDGALAEDAACAEQPVRLTEAATTEAAMAKTDPANKPYGNVQYADPGYQKDGKHRCPLDTIKHVRAAWDYINQKENQAFYTASQLQRVRARIKAAAAKMGITIAGADKATEALINGKLSFSDTSSLVRAAIQQRVSAAAGSDGYGYCYVWIVDLTDTDVVYQAVGDGLWQCAYTVGTDDAGHGSVTLGDPTEVVRTYAPLAPGDAEPDDDDDPFGGGDGGLVVLTEGVTEARDELVGRVLEAKGTDEATGGRIFRVQVITYGDSKNGRRYPEAVMRAAAPLYDGAKAYDHHRSDAELASSTIAGLVGYYRAPEATTEGVQADLYLLPSAAHAAEALDASLDAQGDGLAPLVGISHDVMATYRPVMAGAVRLQEATAIVKVNSADIVADPAAGGKATRMVAGGTGTTTDPAVDPAAAQSTKESTVDTQAVLDALKTATPEQLAAAGLSKSTESTTTSATVPVPATEAVGEPRDSFMGRLMIRQKVSDAGLPEAVVESLTAALPDRITEALLDAQIGGLKSALAVAERAGLAPQHTVQVTQEARQKKVDALDAFFAGDYVKGYRSFREAFTDFTGMRPRAFGEDFHRTILRESWGVGAGAGYDSAVRGTESMDSTTWNVVLGDSITRRLVAEYGQPSLQSWRQVVSSMPPINDFRTQRIERIGGYGTLPAVNQGQPYQPLTSPGNEEATYQITKRGGTEDITLEMIANDDIRAIQRIPGKLGLAAAQTLYRFVWDIFNTNASCSFDSTALFHTNHANTATNALSQSNLSAGRRAMRKQTAYGDSQDDLSIIPRLLVVCSDLEEIAFQLSTSAVAIPATPAGPTNTPNIHQGLQVVTVDYWTSTTAWYLAADPNLVPQIEVGFYQGRQDPELFTQADPTVGSVFNADKITYKIRHIYSGTALDYRGLYRGNS